MGWLSCYYVFYIWLGESNCDHLWQVTGRLLANLSIRCIVVDGGRARLINEIIVLTQFHFGPVKVGKLLERSLAALGEASQLLLLLFAKTIGLLVVIVSVPKASHALCVVRVIQHASICDWTRFFCMLLLAQ